MGEIIEMFWRCRHCRSINPGLTGEDEGLRCTNCGSQKADEPYILPEDVDKAPVVTDSTRLKRAKAGPNWTCSRCRHEERKSHTECSFCGAPSKLGKKLNEASHTDLASSIVNPIRTPSSSSRKLVERTERELEETLSPKAPSAWREIIPVAFGCAFAIALGLLIWWVFFATHTGLVRVTELQWTRTLVLEERHILGGEGWKSQMPSGAFDEVCQRTFKENERCNPYDCNPHSVDYECNCSGGDSYDCNCRRECTPLGNGAAECQQVCSTCRTERTCQTCTRTEYETCYEQCPVYEDWCVYRYPKWEAIDRKENRGVDNLPVWPLLGAQGPEQRIKQHATQHAAFEAVSVDKNWPLRPMEEGVFRRLVVGQEIQAEWTRAGSLELLVPTGE